MPSVGGLAAFFAELQPGDPVGVNPRHEAANGWDAVFVRWSGDPAVAYIRASVDRPDAWTEPYTIKVARLGRPFGGSRA